jgi:hypothetical protein
MGSELGNYYFDLLKELRDETLSDTTFIVYGHDPQGFCHLFEVSPLGQISDRLPLRYAVIGSGYWMATSALQLKPLNFLVGPTIYRLLSAKFSAETATGVGKSTTLTLKSSTAPEVYVQADIIEKIRSVWEKETKKNDPQKAMDALGPVLKRAKVDAAS